MDSDSSDSGIGVTAADNAIQHLKGAKECLIGAREEIKRSSEELPEEINVLINEIDYTIACILELIGHR